MNRAFLLFIILVGLVVFFVQTGRHDELKDMNNPQQNTPNLEIIHQQNAKRYDKIDENLKNISYTIQLKINPTENYNYLKKSEIFAIRKKHVKNSIFYTNDYRPSDVVFGQIEDGKPWYGLRYYNCAGNVKGMNDVTLGDSEESRFINNPNLLIGLDQGAYTMNGDFKRNPLCTERKYIIIPKDAQYNPKLNKITVHYRMPMQHMFILNGVNARDFGYQYIYARQYENIDFKSENNITKNVYRLEDYIHTGGSCGISGGCNNGSPRQTYLDFDTRENTVGKISLKLWRKKPQSSSDTADINYDIIITTSKN